MKKRLLSLFLAMLLLSGLSTVVCVAASRASDYFSATSVRAYAENNGVILFEIDVDATHTMQEVGASHVYVYEQQDDGSWDRTLEIHKERAYTVEELTEWLREAGFTDIRTYGDMKMRRPAENEQRIYFSCVRA